MKRVVAKMRKGATKLEVAQALRLMECRKLEARFVNHPDGCMVVAEGEVKDLSWLEGLAGVEEVVETKSAFPLASRDVRATPTTVSLAPGVQIGGGEVAVIAGPCAVEDRDQILTTAESVKASGAKALRGGAYKPRTNPYSFQGLGSEGVSLLEEARSLTGLPIVTEVMAPEDVEWLLPHVNVFQVGSRNMQNFSLLKTLGRVDKPVLLKRGMMATIDEWLQAAEYVLAGGNSNVILCERGIRCFEKRTRNVLDLSAVPLIKSLSHLPIVVDPSHGTGCRNLVPSMSLAAIAAGADGLIIEVHPNPEKALSDGDQSLTLSEFALLMESVRQLASVLPGRVKEEVLCSSASVA